MESLRIVKGDATAPQVEGNKIIAHVCNDLGRWGKGFVLALSRRWPEPEREYRRWYRARAANDFGLGAVQLVVVQPDLGREHGGPAWDAGRKLRTPDSL
jgi:O-acetyl-ADP-ribose deacetylase (regulator of RNase III)